MLTNRYEMLQESLNSYRREINSQREKIQKLSATSQKYEQIIHTMTQDLREASEKLAVAEVRQRAVCSLMFPYLMLLVCLQFKEQVRKIICKVNVANHGLLDLG